MTLALCSFDIVYCFLLYCLHAAVTTPINLSMDLYVCLSVSLCIRLSVGLCICLSMYPSIYDTRS